MLLSLARTQIGQDPTLKSLESKYCLPSMIEEKEEDILLINSLKQENNAGSADQILMSELNAVNTDVGVKEKKKKRTERVSDTIDMTKDMMIGEENDEMKIDTAVRGTETRRIIKERGQVTASNLQQT